MAGQATREEMLAKAVTMDDRKSRYCRFCSESHVRTRSKCRRLQMGNSSSSAGQNTCKQRCRRSPVGRSRHRQVMVKTGHMPTRQNGLYKRSHESCTKKTRGLRRGRNTAKCRPKVQDRVLKMMKFKRWTWRMNRTAKRSWSSGREKLSSKCGCLMELQNCRKRWWQSRKRSGKRNCRTSSRGAMISCQNVK